MLHCVENRRMEFLRTTGRVTCYLDDIRPLRNFGEGQRLEATFTTDSVMELTPDLVGPSITRNSGIIGERVDLSLDHDDMRQSSLVFHVTKRLLYTKSRDPGEEPKLHLFGQLTSESLRNGSTNISYVRAEPIRGC
jgi:hypothetical protein